MVRNTGEGRKASGFTLIELIVVIAITGIIGGIVATFIRAPVQAYVDSSRRAEMTDIADTALRRISRDIHLALPNSVRVGGGGVALEFLDAPVGGRYRAVADGATDALLFDSNDDTFDVLGTAVTLQAGDDLVVFNLGIQGADAYAGNSTSTHNRRAIKSIGTVSNIAFNAPVNTRLPFESPGHRFHVVRGPVSYFCMPASGGIAGTLRRYWGYTIQAGQPTTLAALNALPGVRSAIMAGNVGPVCGFSYDANMAAQRMGLVTMRLSIMQQDEVISLYSATHVSNVP